VIEIDCVCYIKLKYLGLAFILTYRGVPTNIERHASSSVQCINVPRKPVAATPKDTNAIVDVLIVDDILTEGNSQSWLAQSELWSKLM